MKILTILLLAGAMYLPVNSQNLESGLGLGAECPAFDPYHVSGPDTGTTACPMCKYGQKQGIMVWLNDDDWDGLTILAGKMEAEVNLRGFLQMRVFVIYMNPDKKPLKEVVEKLRGVSRGANLKRVALTCIPGPDDPKSAALFLINPGKAVRNTIFIYKGRRVVDKFVNLNLSEDFSKLIAAYDQATKGKSL